MTSSINALRSTPSAAKPGVPLSLTTYYFKDIDTMIEEAFEQFMERMRPDLDQLWSTLFTYLDGFSAAELLLDTITALEYQWRLGIGPTAARLDARSEARMTIKARGACNTRKFLRVTESTRMVLPMHCR